MIEKYQLLASLLCLSNVVALSTKRGFVADGNPNSTMTCADPYLLKDLSWFYGYNSDNPYETLHCPNSREADFIGMFWCLNAISTPPQETPTTLWLGFNEPNNIHNCNKSPHEIAVAWKQVMNVLPNTLLLSPATAGNGISWLDAFFSNCTTLYGKKGCRISMIALHDYSCNTKSLLSYLSAVHQRYGLPIWLTEFACGDRNAKRPLHDQLSFMQEVVPELEKAAFVQRYAWMSARQRPGDYRALLANYHNGTAYVTELGKLYTSL